MSGHSPAPSKKSLPELLSPAGSPEAFRAAVAAGADAVYLSGKKFGARKFARNFTDAEIEESVNYAHARGVRVYVTVNTLIHDREIASTADYLIWLYSIGVDAVLVQDIGIAGLAREIIPDLVLHASTQMTIYSSDGVRWAAEQGFSRVVLARELSLAEVERIARETKDTGTGVEVFAHGALCYGYSGQCLLSSVIGGRSGNRGMCAQPCRKPYTLITAIPDAYGRPTDIQACPSLEPYLLSPKDLCTYEHLPALVASPITSLKIEGRMKSPEYVAVVVSAYRRALDMIASGNTISLPDEKDNLLLAFNRGFTSGYLFGDRHGALMGRDAPDNRGLFIGKVNRYEAGTRTAYIKIEGKIVLKPGDGLFFSGPASPEQQFGFALNTVPRQTYREEIMLAVPQPVHPGTRVYLTSSVNLTASARQVINHPSTTLRHPIPLDMTVVADDNGRLKLDGCIRTGDGRKITVTHAPDSILVPAQSHPLTVEIMEQQMRKSGGTPFVIDQVAIHYKGDRFAPLAELNRARRDYLTLAESALVASYLPSRKQVDSAKSRWQVRAGDYPETCTAVLPVNPPFPPRLGIYVDSTDAVFKAAEAGCDRVYFEPDIPVSTTASCCCNSLSPGTEEQMKTAVDLCRTYGISLIWKFPRITRNTFSDTVFPLVSRITETGIAGIMVENQGMVHALPAIAPQCDLYGSTGLNVFNHATVQKLSSRVRQLTLSFELSRAECMFLVTAARRQEIVQSFALIVQGTSEVIISEDCLLEPILQCRGHAGKQPDVFYGIRDSTGHLFPVHTDHECRTHIGNSAELCLVDHLPEIMDIGISEVVIDARKRPPAYVSEISHIYRTAIQATVTRTPDLEKQLQALKDRIKRISLGEITAGHFIRGLKEL